MSTSTVRVKFQHKVIPFICDKIAAGQTLENICQTLYLKSPMIPASTKTVYRWIDKYPKFKERYSEAMRVRYLNMHDKIIDAAEEEVPDSGDFKRDQILMRQREFKVRTYLSLSGQLASKYVPELKDKKEVNVNMPEIKIMTYHTPLIPAREEKVIDTHKKALDALDSDFQSDFQSDLQSEKEFLDAAKKAMETHKDALDKLR